MSSSPRPLGSPHRAPSPYAARSPSTSFPPSTEFLRKALLTPFDDVVSAELPWTPRDIGRNAISAVMNDKLPPKPLDNFAPVPPTIIRKVRTPEFDPYLKYLAQVFDKYQYHRAIGLESAVEGIPTLGSSALDDPTYTDLIHTATHLDLLPSDTESQQTGQVFIKKGRNVLTASQRTRMLSANAPSLDIVPKIFFEEDFNLQSPHVFETLTNGQPDVVCENPNETNSASTALQEHFSYLLDTVKVHLLKEIARKSSSFFTALSNLQNLHSETLSCVEQIHQLRSKLRLMRQTGARRGLEALLAQSDYMTALNLVESTSLALRGSSDSGLHVNQNTNSPILSILPTTTPETIAPGITMIRSSAIPCGMMESGFVKNLLDKINEPFTMSASSSVDAPAMQYIQNIINQRYAPSTINPPAPIDLTDAMLEKEGKLRDRLERLVLGLLRMDRLGSALSVYRDSLLLEIKALAKKHYPPIVPLHSGTCETAAKRDHQLALAKQLRGMTFDAFLDIMLRVYVMLLGSLDRVATSNAVICHIIKRAQDTGVQIGADSPQTLQLPPQSGSEEALNINSGSTQPANPSQAALLRKRLEEEDDDFGASAGVLSPAALEAATKVSDNTKVITAPVTTMSDSKPPDQKGNTTYTQMLAESAEILYSASDLAQVRCAKLLSVRAEQNAQLNPKDFYRLFGATWEFITGSEALCGRMCLGLKGNMLSQAKAYLNHFHEERTKQIALLIETARSFGSPPSVRASPSNKPSSLQRTSSSQVPASSSNTSLLKVDDDDDDDDKGSRASTSSLSGKGSKKFVIVNGQKYYMVGCILMFLKQLTEYMQCMENVPVLTAEVLNRIMEILKLVNNRLCQVILGAGAMKSAGLKNITARHIALAAQSLGVVVVLIPYLKVGIQLHLPPKQAVLLNDMDRLIKDYRDHQAELYAKLVGIMMERVTVHSKNLLAVNWDSPSPKDFAEEDGDVSTHMVTLVKETMTLHKVLAKYLDPETLKTVMGDVFKSYVKRLEDDLKKLDLFTSAGKNRLLIDVQYFIFKLSSLHGCDGPGTHLEVAVNNTKIKDRLRQVVHPRASSEANHGALGASSAALAASPTSPLPRSPPTSSPSAPGVPATAVHIPPPVPTIAPSSPAGANASNHPSSWTTKSAYYRNALGGMFARAAAPAAPPSGLLALPPPMVKCASDTTNSASNADLFGTTARPDPSDGGMLRSKSTDMSGGARSTERVDGQPRRGLASSGACADEMEPDEQPLVPTVTVSEPSLPLAADGVANVVCTRMQQHPTDTDADAEPPF
ncbi:hypothetical protein SeMB42_g00804 [Synchytrium endobioticum]|uniref:Vacuolar protein sorting-associated protein 54 C-terminal domain-containing protein n=1 Tax=Synchytrium endobioticum TaxID=286115 RepID=A0A507DQA6_9FUNG|nr:hypothetical protein SeMB42_g00804 [Synchytrium endobioticum]